MGILRACLNRGDILDDLTRLDQQLQRVVKIGESDLRRSVSTTGRVERPWAMQDRLSEQEILDLVAAFQGGATKLQLAEQYDISPKSVQRLLRRHGVRRVWGRSNAVSKSFWIHADNLSMAS